MCDYKFVYLYKYMKGNLVKFAVVAALVAPAFLAAAPAFAATYSNGLFNNGNSSISANPGSTVNLSFQLTVGSSETIQCLEIQVNGSNLPPQYINEGGTTGLEYTTQPYPMTVPVVLPQNTGSYQVQVEGFGNYGGTNDGCSGSATGGSTFGPVDVINTSNAPSGGVFGGITTNTQQLLASLLMQYPWLASLLGASQSTTTTTTPTTTTLCQNFNSARGSLTFGMSDAAGLQTFLINNGEAGILTYGTTGYYGSQTASAVSAFQSANHC